VSDATLAVPAIRGSRRSGLSTLIVAAMVALPPLSIDMVLPALPSIASSLQAPIGRAGLAISLFLVAFAISQVVLGPLSDRLGRRPVMLASCALFSAAGIGAALARRGVSHVTVLLGGILLGLSGSGVLLLLATAGRVRVATAIPTLLLVTTALGLITPSAAHGVLEPMPHVAGTASAVLGFVRMSGGALASALVSLSSAKSPTALAVLMTLFASGALVTWIAAVSPHRRAPPSSPPLPLPTGPQAT
jgi:DHA1 family bicyclomycin/chloramphenicol resistance-like MFS transporter